MADGTNKYQIIVSASINKVSLDGIQKQLDKQKFVISNISLSPEALKKIRDQVSGAINKNKTSSGGEAYAPTNMGDAGDATDKQAKSFDNMANSADKAGKNIGKVKSANQLYIESIGSAIVKTVQWATAMTLFYGTLRQIESGIQYVTDLNKEMTNIRLVTGATKKEVADLAIEYNQLAKELGATTLEVAKGSVQWARQGKSAEETSELLKASVMMGKLANLDQAQSTEYLTSIINGYKLSLEEVMPTVSKLVSLDNSYATSVGRQKLPKRMATYGQYYR